MPTLILARHAKAEKPGGIQDMDRPLALIGRQASAKLGAELVEAGLKPTLALVSPANRTQQTWNLMSKAFADCQERIVDDLYETHVDGLLEVLHDIEDEETVIVVGHEPTSSAATAYLAADGSDTPSLKFVAHGLRTATAAVLTFDGPWSSLGSRTATLTTVISGRDVD
ncbi:SixA phosphatase family protein [Demequina sediminicola]|uniref:SixA phosphatase family protein n=1 Tax=Demequina sediminicola TaxID=1095026 RepID=UPI0007825198|nr:histidine phosphatase family protein [Demequina sediminicola]